MPLHSRIFQRLSGQVGDAVENGESVPLNEVCQPTGSLRLEQDAVILLSFVLGEAESGVRFEILISRHRRWRRINERCGSDEKQGERDENGVGGFR